MDLEIGVGWYEVEIDELYCSSGKICSELDEPFNSDRIGGNANWQALLAVGSIGYVDNERPAAQRPPVDVPEYLRPAAVRTEYGDMHIDLHRFGHADMHRFGVLGVVAAAGIDQA